MRERLRGLWAGSRVWQGVVALRVGGNPEKNHLASSLLTCVVPVVVNELWKSAGHCFPEDGRTAVRQVGGEGAVH